RTGGEGGNGHLRGHDGRRAGQPRSGDGLARSGGLRMTFDLRATVAERRGESFRLHSAHLNPQMVKVLRTIGFDRFYERGEGCYLFDRDGAPYLDLLAGFGGFALGRGHPVANPALRDRLAPDSADVL